MYGSVEYVTLFSAQGVWRSPKHTDQLQTVILNPKNLQQKALLDSAEKIRPEIEPYTPLFYLYWTITESFDISLICIHRPLIFYPFLSLQRIYILFDRLY